ncbi:MAG: ferredoxin--NADP reductase [Terricaulis sp.]
MSDATIEQTKHDQPTALPVNLSSERVLDVRHYTERLFRFTTTRPTSLRFRAGEFVMIGLRDAARPLLRAYSIASPPWDDKLEFYSIVAPGGPLTSRLRYIEPGDEVLVGHKATGTLVVDALTPARRLFLFSTGTGFAPFASVLRDADTYAKFDEVIVTHTCREAAELRYSHDIVAALAEDPLVGDVAPARVRRYATCTRQEAPHTGRITGLIECGKLFADLSVASLDPACDRAMICGALPFIQDMRGLLVARGFAEGANANPGDFVVERAFAG